MSSKRKQPDPSLLDDILLGIEFPRCTVCELDWFLDDDEKGDQEKKHHNLIPMPTCKCSSTLIYEPLEYKFTDLPEPNQLGSELVQRYCIPEKVKKYNRKGMCKGCLETFVRTADDVIEHDYMSDTQPNQKFSVGGRCVICHQRFTPRSLAALNGNRNGNQTKEMQEWFNSIKNTIDWIHYRKKLYRQLKLRNYDIQISQEYPSLVSWLETRDGNDSDDCFSEDECKQLLLVNSSKYQPRRDGVIAPENGEIKRQLLEKDPLFKQECEDYEYIRIKSQTKEGRRELGIESDDENNDGSEQLKRDEMIAIELQQLERRVSGPKKRHSIEKFLERVSPSSKKAARRRKREIDPSSVPYKASDSGIKKFLKHQPNVERSILSDSDDSSIDVKISPNKKKTQEILLLEDDSASKEQAPAPKSSIITLLDDSSDEEQHVSKVNSSRDQPVGSDDMFIDLECQMGQKCQDGRPTLETNGNTNVTSESCTLDPDVHVLDDTSDTDMPKSTSRVGNSLNENDVKLIMEMGFTSNEAKRALRRANHDRILAMNILVDEEEKKM
jgi:NACalpha-BTF3-like transcription factor